MKNRQVFLLAIIFTFILISIIHSSENQPLVQVIKINGVINPASAEFVNRCIEKASSKKANLIIIELDTPGGLDTSMRSIVKDISASPIPVVVYVSPSGARAASAGVFITLSAHIAVMAPGTNIGAAHPVAVGEKMDKTVAEKAVNDAAAYIKSIAESHGRNAEWAEQSVRKSASITEKEALKLKVIDFIAEDLNALLKAIDKKTVKTAIGEKVINITNAKIVYEEKGMRHKVLDFISDPNVAYMLMLIGFYGIFFELTNPGSIFPGVIGVISLILAFYSFQTLPVNYAGLLLILAGLVLFLLEIKVASYGLLTLGGIASIILGSLMLFDSADPFMRLSLSIIIPAAIVSALFFIITFRLAYKAYKSKPVTGIESMIGEIGIAKEPIDNQSGKVYINGEIWNARSDNPIEANSEVIVESIKGLVLKVKKA
ncbi:MAG: nodulation protein NfeD [Thermodesulfovibrionales bacterium]|nr:nodulation protein NfeD [Thermodesulfovibrionales bacterium]